MHYGGLYCWEDKDMTAFRRRKRRIWMYDYDWLSEDWACMIACMHRHIQ
jgi:hypothetical protein